MHTLGRHLIAEFYGCDRAALDDVDRLRALMESATQAVGATPLAVHAHRYAPQGVTATVMIAESHLSIHTWPEHGYAAVDIFTCGGLDPRPGFVHVGAGIGAKQCRVQELLRGLDDHVPPDATVAPGDVVRFSNVTTLTAFSGAGEPPPRRSS